MITTGKNPAYITPEASAKALISSLGKAVWSKAGDMVFWGNWHGYPEWEEAVGGTNTVEADWEIKDVFTAAETAELKKTHGTADVNWQRAKAVKKALEDGFDTVNSVASALPSFGRTQISKDLAALKAAN